VSRAIRHFVINQDDEQTIVHLRGPILKTLAYTTNFDVSILLFAHYDDTIPESVHIIRLFQSGETIPYHFEYVDTVSFGGQVRHVCAYREGDEVWTPVSIQDDAVPSANSSEAPSS
jgi:hypothetical protein